MQFLIRLLKRYWFVPILVGVLILTIVLRYMTPKRVEKPVQTNTFNGVTPGFSTKEEVFQTLGQPLDTKRTEFGEKLEYDSGYPAFPTEFSFQQNTLVLVKERIPPEKSLQYASFLQSLGREEAIAYSADWGQFFPFYIYASKGIAIAKHSDGNILEIWRFPATTINEFFASWGQGLNQQPEGPEPADVEETPSSQAQ